MVEIFKNFLEFILKAKDFEIYIAETDEDMNDTVNFFVSLIDDPKDEEKVEKAIEFVYGFERIIWCELWLNQRDYNKIISSWQGREYIKNEQFITNVLTEDGTQMMMLQFMRVKEKNIPKSVEEYENELDDAVKLERYEEAAKIKKKIQSLVEKKKKKPAKKALKKRALKKTAKK